MAAEADVGRVSVTLAGEEFVLRGEGQPGYLEDLAARVDGRLRELAKANPRLGLSRVALLCALNLADELAKLEEQYQRVLAMLEKEWERRKQELAATAEPAAPPQG